MGYKTTLTCAFDSFCQILLTTSIDRKDFKTSMSPIKLEIFEFVRRLASKRDLTSSDYRKRAKILVPYVEQVYPEQIQDMKEIKIVDCSCNFGDVLRHYAKDNIASFTWQYSICTEGHEDYTENNISIFISSESLKTSTFIQDELINVHEQGCTSVNNDGSVCQGRRTKRLIDAGKY